MLLRWLKEKFICSNCSFPSREYKMVISDYKRAAENLYGVRGGWEVSDEGITYRRIKPTAKEKNERVEGRKT
jgi:hypothetical protein